jgi:hypothetical protein
MTLVSLPTLAFGVTEVLLFRVWLSSASPDNPWRAINEFIGKVSDRNA